MIKVYLLGPKIQKAPWIFAGCRILRMPPTGYKVIKPAPDQLINFPIYKVLFDLDQPNEKWITHIQSFLLQ